VAAHYGPQLLSGWLVDEKDADAVDAPELAGISVRAVPLYMTDLQASADIARAALDLAGELGVTGEAGHAPEPGQTRETGPAGEPGQ